MALLFKIITWFAGVFVCFAALVLIAGQAGLLRGHAPTDLGVKNGRLKPPSMTPNSVSSQASLYPDHPQRAYADIAPLAYSGSASSAMDKLAQVVQNTSGCSIQTRQGDYLYAQCRTRWLHFTDYVEFWADPVRSVIQVRSASRLGRKDFGVNRARIEGIRAAFTR